MIGDTPYDVEAATRAGIRIVGFESGGWSEEALRVRSPSTAIPRTCSSSTAVAVRYVVPYFLKTASRFAGFACGAASTGRRPS